MLINVRWKTKAKTWDQLVEWVIQAAQLPGFGIPGGKDLRKDLLSGGSANQIRIVPLSELPKSEIPAMTAHAQVGGAFSSSEGVKRIYLDLRSECVGVVAAWLVHELNHAYDGTYLEAMRSVEGQWKQLRGELESFLKDADRKNYSREIVRSKVDGFEKRQKNLARVAHEARLESEVRAYRNMFDWIEEVGKTQAGYLPFLEKISLEKGYRLYPRVSESEIRKMIRDGDGDQNLNQLAA